MSRQVWPLKNWMCLHWFHKANLLQKDSEMGMPVRWVYLSPYNDLHNLNVWFGKRESTYLGGYFMYTSSMRTPCMNAFWTSNWHSGQLNFNVMVNIIRIMHGLLIELNVSPQSIHSCWFNPLATRLDLYRSIEPSGFLFYPNNPFTTNNVNIWLGSYQKPSTIVQEGIDFYIHFLTLVWTHGGLKITSRFQ